MIYMIRHGQTELNNRSVLQGRSDYPLNGSGIVQAEAAARRLRERGIAFDRVFSSPLIRAIQTARIVSPGLEPMVDARLIEMDYGPFEGADLTRPSVELATFFRDFIHNPAPEGMEPLASVVGRVAAFIEDIRYLPGNTLISTHAIAMKGILETLTPGSGGAYWSKHIGNCAVYAVENKSGVLGIPDEIL